MASNITQTLKRILRPVIAGIITLSMPGCEDFDARPYFWRITNKTALFATLISVCVVLAVSSRKTKS
jgi:hypothetical protein